MAKFHINPEGEPGKCTAAAGRCPYGGEDQHFDSASDARKAYELVMRGAGWTISRRVPEVVESIPLPNGAQLKRAFEVVNTLDFEEASDEWGMIYSYSSLGTNDEASRAVNEAILRVENWADSNINDSEYGDGTFGKYLNEQWEPIRLKLKSQLEQLSEKAAVAQEIDLGWSDEQIDGLAKALELEVEIYRGDDEGPNAHRIASTHEDYSLPQIGQEQADHLNWLIRDHRAGDPIDPQAVENALLGGLADERRNYSGALEAGKQLYDYIRGDDIERYEKKILNELDGGSELSFGQLWSASGFTEATVKSTLRKLEKMGLVRRVGKDYYHLNDVNLRTYLQSIGKHSGTENDPVVLRDVSDRMHV